MASGDPVTHKNNFQCDSFLFPRPNGFYELRCARHYRCAFRSGDIPRRRSRPDHVVGEQSQENCRSTKVIGGGHRLE
jgi:hypothetical protein